MMYLKFESLERCPYCAQLSWECEHEIVRYFSPERALTPCRMEFEVRQAGQDVVDLLLSCRRRAVSPKDKTAATLFSPEPPDEGEPEEWGDGVHAVVQFLGALRQVKETESEGDWALLVG